MERGLSTAVTVVVQYTRCTIPQGVGWGWRRGFRFPPSTAGGGGNGVSRESVGHSGNFRLRSDPRCRPTSAHLSPPQPTSSSRHQRVTRPHIRTLESAPIWGLKHKLSLEVAALCSDLQHGISSPASIYSRIRSIQVWVDTRAGEC